MMWWLKSHSLRRKQHAVTKEDLYVFWTGAMGRRGVGRKAIPDKAKQNENVLLVREIHVVKINGSQRFAAIPHPSCLLQREHAPRCVCSAMSDIQVTSCSLNFPKFFFV